MLKDNAKELIEKAIEMAKGGDGPALRLCIERLEALWSAPPVAMPFKNLRLKRLYLAPAKRPDKRAEAGYLAAWYQIEQQAAA